MYAQVIDGQALPLFASVITDAEGTRHPRVILNLWSEAELATIGVYPVADLPPLAPSEVEVSSDLVWTGTAVERVRTVRGVTPEELAAQEAQALREQKRLAARALLQAGPPPQTLPGLAERVAAIELLLGLRDA